MDGSYSLQLRMSSERSVTDSEMYPYSLWQGLPPKVIRRAMSRKEESLMDAWDRDLENDL